MSLFSHAVMLPIIFRKIHSALHQTLKNCILVMYVKVFLFDNLYPVAYLNVSIIVYVLLSKTLLLPMLNIVAHFSMSHTMLYVIHANRILKHIPDKDNSLTNIFSLLFSTIFIENLVIFF